MDLRARASTDFYIPTTVSQRAQAVLAFFSLDNRNIAAPEPDDIEGWKQVWQANEDLRVNVIQEVVDEFQPTITERPLGEVNVLDIKLQGWQDNGKVLVFIHGGGYTLYSARSTLGASISVAQATGLQVISVDYTVAPNAKWPAITDEVISVIQALETEGYQLSDIAICGESAGGALAAATVLKMRDQGMGMPVAVVLWSPWSDITETGDTYITLKDVDPILSYSPFLSHAAAAYADPDDQTHPYVSPVYADYSLGFPPTLIQVGTKEIFLSNCVRHYQALDQAHQDVKLDVYEGMWHSFQFFGGQIPETIVARQKMADFLAEKLMAK